MRWAALALLAVLTLSGCGWRDEHISRDPTNPRSPIGKAYPDLVSAMGKPDSAMLIKPDVAIVQYDHKETTAGLKLTVTLVGSVEVGGGGACSAVFTVLRDGTIATVNFANSYSSGVISAPYSECESLMAEPLSNMPDTGIPAHYDAFDYMPLAKKLN